MNHDVKWLAGGLGTAIIVMAGWLFILTQEVGEMRATKVHLERRVFDLEKVWVEEVLSDRQELKQRMLLESE